MPAMNDNAIFLTYRVDCIAGKPPPTVRCLLRVRRKCGGASHGPLNCREPQLLHPHLNPPVLDPSIVQIIGRYGHLIAKPQNFTKGHTAFLQFTAHGHGSES